MRWALALVLVASCSGSPEHGAPDAGSSSVSDLRSTTLVHPTSADALFVLTELDDAGAAADVHVAVTVRGATTDLAPSVGGYGASVPLDGGPVEDEPVEVTVSLGGEVATSSVTLPAGFAIGQVTGTPEMPPFSFTWSPTRSDPMHWEGHAVAPAGHPCTLAGSASEGSVPDTGSATLTQPLDASGGIDCMLTVSLVRTRSGTVTNAAPGSSITAEQSHDVYP